MAQVLSELAEDMMARVRRTCGTENAKRVLERAEVHRRENRSESNFTMTRDVLAALEEMKLMGKYNGGKPFAETGPIRTENVSVSRFTPIKPKAQAQGPRRVKRGKGQ